MKPIVPMTEESAASTAPDPSLIAWSPALFSRLPCGRGLVAIRSGYSGGCSTGWRELRDSTITLLPASGFGGACTSPPVVRVIACYDQTPEAESKSVHHGQKDVFSRDQASTHVFGVAKQRFA